MQTMETKPNKAGSQPHNARWYDTQARLEQQKVLLCTRDLVKLYFHDEAVIRTMHYTKDSAIKAGIKLPVSIKGGVSQNSTYYDMIQQVKWVFKRIYSEIVTETYNLPTHIVYGLIKKSFPELSKYHLPESWASIQTCFWKTLGLKNQSEIAWLKESIRCNTKFIPQKSLFEVLCAMGTSHAYIHYRLYEHIVDLEPAMLVALDLGLFAEDNKTTTLGEVILDRYGNQSATRNALHYLRRLALNFPAPQLTIPIIYTSRNLAYQSLLVQLTKEEIEAIGTKILAIGNGVRRFVDKLVIFVVVLRPAPPLQISAMENCITMEVEPC
jgi:hypothetical protein